MIAEGKTVLPNPLNRLAKPLAASIAVTATAVAIGVGLNPTYELTVNVEGSTLSLATAGGTIEDALRDGGVELTSAVVSPATTTEVKSDLEVTVAYRRPLDLEVDGQRISTHTTAPTLDRALDTIQASGTAIAHDAYVSVDRDAELPRTGLKKTVVVSNPKTVELSLAGKTRTLVTTAATVGEVLEAEVSDLHPADEVNLDPTTEIKDGLMVSVVDIAIKEKTTKKKTPPKVVVKKDDSLPEGTTKVLAKGKPKVVAKSVKLVYADGKLRDRKASRTTVVSRGKPRVVVKGTKPVVSDKPTGGSCGDWGKLLDEHFGSQAGTACRVMMCESGGNPRAQNPVSTASGIFQFIDGSWRSARSAVAGGDKYARAKDAPAEIQIEAAAKWLKRTSWQQWECY